MEVNIVCSYKPTLSRTFMALTGKNYCNILLLFSWSILDLSVAGRMAQSGAAPLFLLLLLCYCKATAVYQHSSESEYITWRSVHFTDNSNTFEKKCSVRACLNRQGNKLFTE
jgi:hypothetical protein